MRGGRRRIGIIGRHVRIIGAADQPLRAVQLALERRGIDPAGELLDQRRIEARKGGDPRRDARDRGGVALALDEIEQIVARRVVLDVAQRLAAVLPLGVERRRRHRRQVIDPGHRHVARFAEIGEVDHRRDHHQAADADALILEQMRDLRRAKAAIAFAGDELDRLLAPGLLDPFADEHGERLGVAVDRPEAPATLIAARRNPAVAGAGRIDEHEVGEVEPGLGVGDQPRWLGYGKVRERQPPRPDGAEVEIGRCGAGAAVEHEGHGARHVARDHIGDVGDLGEQRAVVRIVERNRAGGRAEMQRATGQLDRLIGGRIGGKLALGGCACGMRGRAIDGRCRRRRRAIAMLGPRGWPARGAEARDDERKQERSAAPRDMRTWIGHEANPDDASLPRRNGGECRPRMWRRGGCFATPRSPAAELRSRAVAAAGPASSSPPAFSSSAARPSAAAAARGRARASSDGRS